MYCGVPEEDPEQLVALVLSGGESRRMGQDKGMLEYKGTKWIQLAGDLCRSAGLSVYYSINQNQQTSYHPYIQNDKTIVDTVQVKGPLAGLFSFYLKYPEKDVLLLPCDMMHLDKDVLHHLLEEYKVANLAHEVLVYQHADGSVEPMPGVYSAEAIRKLFWLYTSGELLKFSLKHCIEISNTCMITMPEKFSGCFINANTPDDLNRF